MKKKWKNYLIFYSVCIIIGVVLGIYASVGEPFYEPLLNHLTFLNFITVLIFLVMALFLVINIHEFGHLVFGKAVGMTLLLYRIGFLEWKKVNGAFRLAIEKNKGYSGLCGMIPDPKKDIKNRQFLLYLSGGIIFNLLSAALGYYFINNTTGLVNLFLWLFTLLSLFLGLSNAIPFKTSTNMLSDGAYIIGLLKRDKVVMDRLQMINFSTEVLAGMAPSQLNFSKVAGNEDIHYDILKHLKALEELDLATLKKTTDVLERRIDGCDVLTLPTVKNELVVSYILLGDPEGVEKWRETLTHLSKDKDANGYRVKAYLAYFDGDNQLARDYLNKGRAVLNTYPSIGQQKVEAVLFDALAKNLNDMSLQNDTVSETL